MFQKEKLAHGSKMEPRHAQLAALRPARDVRAHPRAARARQQCAPLCVFREQRGERGPLRGGREGVQRVRIRGGGGVRDWGRERAGGVGGSGAWVGRASAEVAG